MGIMVYASLRGNAGFIPSTLVIPITETPALRIKIAQQPYRIGAQVPKAEKMRVRALFTTKVLRPLLGHSLPSPKP